MSTTTKTGIALVIALAIILIGWILVFEPKNEPIVEQKQEVVPTPVEKLPNTAGTGMSDMNDISQEGLQADIDAFGNQMTELNTETSNIDSGLKETI